MEIALVKYTFKKTGKHLFEKSNSNSNLKINALLHIWYAFTQVYTVFFSKCCILNLLQHDLTNVYIFIYLRYFNDAVMVLDNLQEFLLFVTALKTQSPIVFQC